MLFLNSFLHFKNIKLLRLTVTNVVFEYKMINDFDCESRRLTVTNVVFEFGYGSSFFIYRKGLTVTNVVFE